MSRREQSWRMPRQVPPFSMMMEDIGHPSLRIVSRHFRVTEGTVKRWIRTENPPLSVQYAVFWLTSWGRQHIHAEAEMLAQMHAGLYECLRRENETLKRRIEHLERVGDFGSANDPLMLPWLSSQKKKLQIVDIA